MTDTTRRELIAAVGAGGLAGGVVGFATNAMLETPANQEPNFELAEVGAPSQIPAGSDVEINYLVRNTGTESGKIALTLQTFNDQNNSLRFLSQRTLSIAPNDERLGTFTHTPQSSGTHFYRFDGFATLIRVIVR